MDSARPPLVRPAPIDDCRPLLLRPAPLDDDRPLLCRPTSSASAVEPRELREVLEFLEFLDPRELRPPSVRRRLSSSSLLVCMPLDTNDVSVAVWFSISKARIKRHQQCQLENEGP